MTGLKKFFVSQDHKPIEYNSNKIIIICAECGFIKTSDLTVEMPKGTKKVKNLCYMCITKAFNNPSITSYETEYFDGFGNLILLEQKFCFY